MISAVAGDLGAAVQLGVFAPVLAGEQALHLDFIALEALFVDRDSRGIGGVRALLCCGRVVPVAIMTVVSITTVKARV